MALAAAENGNLWIGTPLGTMAVYDGDVWEVIGKVPTVENELEWPREIALDANGRVWVIVETNQNKPKRVGASVLDNGTWTVYDETSSGLPSNYIWAVTTDPLGRVWFGTDTGVAMFDNEQWTVYNATNSGLAGNDVRVIGFDNQSRGWFVTNGGLSLLYNGQWTTYAYEEIGLEYHRVTSMAFDSEGRVWFGLQSTRRQHPSDPYPKDGGVLVFNGELSMTYTGDNSNLKLHSVSDIAVDTRGYVWCTAEKGGVSVLNGLSWTNYGLWGPIPSRYVKGGVEADSLGRVWIGTANGVAVFDRGRP